MDKHSPLFVYATAVIELDKRLGESVNLLQALRDVEPENALIAEAEAVVHVTQVMLRAALQEWSDQALDDKVLDGIPRSEDAKVGLCYDMVSGRILVIS